MSGASLPDVVASADSCLFLSPHLDDAVLSCGALIDRLVGSRPVTVATVFTESDRPPHTRAARSFLGQCGAPDAATLFADRRAEDRAVLDRLGAATEHLGHVDALFRRGSRPWALRRAAGVLPELDHRYPTFRFDIARGRVARGDRALVGELGERVAGLRDASGPGTVVFAPLGVGRHVDHLIVRTAAAALDGTVVYYADFPYSLAAEPDHAFVEGRGLVPHVWADGVAEKDGMIRGYTSQVDALFPSGVIPIAPETYFTN